MLLEELRKAIEDMEEIKNLEQDSQDSQRQSKIDKSYAEKVKYNHRIVDSIEDSRKFVTFIPSSALKEDLLQLLSYSQKCIESGLAQENHLKDLQNTTKSVREKFMAEWNIFYKEISDKRLHALAAIKEITPNKEKAGYAINKIKNGAVISFENADRVKLLAEGILESDDIFVQLGLDKENEIMIFLDKVSDRKATMLDLTDTIVKWIEEKNLADRFFVSFGW